MRWRTTTRTMITTRTTTIIRVAQLWDMIETWGFCEDIKDNVYDEVAVTMENLEIQKFCGFSQGQQGQCGQWIH